MCVDFPWPSGCSPPQRKVVWRRLVSQKGFIKGMQPTDGVDAGRSKIDPGTGQAAVGFVESAG